MAESSNNSRHTLRDLKLEVLAMLEAKGSGDGMLANQLRSELYPDPADQPARKPRPVKVVALLERRRAAPQRASASRP
jgi:hypothetical protein